MSVIEDAQAVQWHRETYIAMLKGALRQPGSKREFAARVGITPEYLSYLLDPYDRTPGPALAERIAQTVPLDPEQRESLLEHLLLASVRRLRIDTDLRRTVADSSFTLRVAELQQAHHLAGFTQNSAQARKLYQAVRMAGRALLAGSDTTVDPLDLIELCLLLHDAESVLNQHGDALYHAKLARQVLDWIDESQQARHAERYGRHQVNVLRAAAVSYHNLKLPREAYKACQEVDALAIVRRQAQTWKPHLYRDMINALSGTPRFALSAVEGMADQVRRLCLHQGDAISPLWELLIDRSLARAYLRYGNVKKARRLLRNQIDMFDHMPMLGPLHRVAILGTIAELSWSEHDRSSWEHYIRDTLAIAVPAGLQHQIREMQRRYGGALDPLLEDWKVQH